MPTCIYRVNECKRSGKCPGCPLAILKNTAITTAAMVDVLLGLKSFCTLKDFETKFILATGINISRETLRSLVNKLNKLGYLEKRRVKREVEFRAISPVPIEPHQSFSILVRRYQNERKKATKIRL